MNSKQPTKLQRLTRARNYVMFQTKGLGSGCVRALNQFCQELPASSLERQMMQAKVAELERMLKSISSTMLTHVDIHVEYLKQNNKEYKPK